MNTTEDTKGAEVNERVFVSVEDAMAMMKDGDRVHTFRNSGAALVGADWPRQDLVDAFRKYGAELAGPAATKANHGLVFHDESSFVFVETKTPPKVANL